MASKIEKKLKELELKLKSSLSQAIKEKKHFFNSICYTKTGKKVFLKMLLQKEKRFYRSILREIKIVKFLTENPAFKNLKITPYLYGNEKDSPPWFIHKYIEGDIIGEFYEIYPPYQDKKYIPLIVNNLKVIHSIPNSVIQKIKNKVKELEKVNYKAYPKIVRDFQKNVKSLTFSEKKVRGKEPNLKINFNKIYEFLTAEKDSFPLLRKVITHGDFTLANHIFSKEKIYPVRNQRTSNEMYLTDWEWVRLDNIAADIAHLWLQTWRYPKWRKELLLTFLSNLSLKEKIEFEKAFRITVIIQALGEIRWNAQICKKKYKKGVIAASEKAIKNALKGFEKLIK